MFKCSKCGLCCRNISGIASLEEFDRGDGVCGNLDEKTNLCKIYESRPLVCNVDLAYEKVFFKTISKEDYYRLNYDACERLKKGEKNVFNDVE